MSREAVDRMTKQIIQANRGKVSPEAAKKIAVDTAKRHERNSKKKR